MAHRSTAGPPHSQRPHSRNERRELPSQAQQGNRYAPGFRRQRRRVGRTRNRPPLAVVCWALVCVTFPLNNCHGHCIFGCMGKSHDDLVAGVGQPVQGAVAQVGSSKRLSHSFTARLPVVRRCSPRPSRMIRSPSRSCPMKVSKSSWTSVPPIPWLAAGGLPS